MTKAHDLTGQRFGMLVAIKKIRTVKNHTHWLCQCDCGRQSEPEVTCLIRGRTKSCGCKIGTKSHGLTDTDEYKVWRSMRARCNNSKSPFYKYYGGRGISVSVRWDSFENFLSDMGKRPSSKHSIDRINNDLGYEPTNCRWATASQQMRNNRGTRFITVNGVTDCVAGWAERLGIPRSRISNVIHKKHASVEQYIAAWASAARNIKERKR